MRGTSNSPVTCFPRQSGATPRLTDGVLGPDNPTSTTTDYAYTLDGLTPILLFENWIQFDFVSRISLASVTLHYYCTGQSPQLQLQLQLQIREGSFLLNISPFSPPCGSTTRRQCFTFSLHANINITSVSLRVIRDDSTMYISEVKFFEGQPHNFYQRLHHNYYYQQDSQQTTLTAAQ